VEFWPVNVDNGLGYCWKRFGGIVKRTFALLAIAALTLTGAALAQDAAKPEKNEKKKTANGASAAAVAHGKDLFEKKCMVCHYADSDQKKIGPGLKGLSKRGTFTVNNNKVTDENLRTWIENGDNLMPPFKDVLEPNEIKDIIAYVKTL
jgi:mono/diheme cytochrome c family protein